VSLTERAALFAAALWEVARLARELEARLPDDIELPALEAELAAIVASLR
jgi:hypothetical protein